jgi:hypothetical protein
MQWETLGFKENPFTTDPIKQDTLNLYVGRQEEMAICKNVLSSKNINLVVEGERGVGTTSFANCLRFHAQEKHFYFTPTGEIPVQEKWSLEALLAVVIANVVREIELLNKTKLTKDKRFQDAKAISARIAEAYRSFGVEAFGFGLSYGKNGGIASQPVIVPSTVLGHHLEDLAKVVQQAGYKYGLLIQLNNLDIGTIHSEEHLRGLFNALRDYLQIDGISWIFVGDIGLRQFIAQQVDRLDDIISYEALIDPLTTKEYKQLIEKRIEYYRKDKHIKLPIDFDVFTYLYKVTKGRLRYVFGLVDRLTNKLSLGNLTDKITLAIAKPVIIKLAQSRIGRCKLNPSEIDALQVIVKNNEIQAGDIAKKLGKSTPHTSKLLAALVSAKLIHVTSKGRKRIYSPLLDAQIAFSDSA